MEEGAITSQGFTLWPQSERTGRNPQTGSPALIPARNSVKFKPGKDMLKFLNKGE
ncbi:HU family DNA-binding protein [Parabacteroides gordonii]|uniref:HU family DNA-binding protein n=1 Tax=Parabacteroides gordonii TaxID=574930 RepID=UPI00350E4D28